MCSSLENRSNPIGTCSCSFFLSISTETELTLKHHSAVYYRQLFLLSYSVLCSDVAEKNDKPSPYLMTVGSHAAKSADPLASLAKQLGGSKRNALLKWCQNRTATYTVCISIYHSCHNEYVLFLVFACLPLSKLKC